MTWRQGTKASNDNPGAALASWFLAIRVRPASWHIPRAADRSLPACWPGGGRRRRARRLLAVHPPGRHSLDQLARLAKIRWQVEHDYRELKTGLGADHFEGRSYLGWHRHVTLSNHGRAQIRCAIDQVGRCSRSSCLAGMASTGQLALC